MNVGLCVFATIVLVGGFVAELSKEPTSGLVLLLIALLLIMVVNLRDLVAHLGGIDYRFPLMGFDKQLALVEFAVLMVQVSGALLSFLGILFLFIQLSHISGKSLLFLVGSILNIHEQAGRGHHGLKLLLFNAQQSFLINAGQDLGLDRHLWKSNDFYRGLANVVKVFKMQQIDGLRLEKLRGGAQERLIREREGHSPLILEEERRRKMIAAKTRAAPLPATTPYKDVLVG
ncbi:hypothetical protein NC651_033277 [Populus alba x Populus x berolinensis]|nr:hypothetical protein NC651_033277 [Populus alba x Populus x berolinensis]